MTAPAPLLPIERRQVLLSVDEIALYLGDRSEAFQLLHDLRIKRFDYRRPPLIDLRIVDAWVRRRRRTTD